MWLIGGPTTRINSSPQRQFEVFIDHMEEKHTMPFKLEQGRCVNVDDEQAMACGGWHEPRECWFFDGETEIWTKTHDTVDNHHQGAMARYNNSVIFFGGIENEQGSTEFFNKGSKPT